MSSTSTINKPVFYGWWNVLCAFVGFMFSHATIAVFSFGSFVIPLQAEFGWQRGEVAFALTVNNLTVLILSPLLGILIDKLGVRRILIPSLVLLGIVVASMALQTGNIWYFYLMYFLIPVAGVGTLPHSYSRVVVAWFRRRRGFALGLSLAGVGAGAALVPVLVRVIIDLQGWRTAYVVYGLLVLLISLPLSYFLLRETPQEKGLHVDGLDADDSNSTSTISDALGVSAGMTMKESILTRSFWLILVSFLLAGMVMSSMFVHMVPMLIDRGLSPSLAAYGAAALGISLIIGRIISGLLMDRYFAPYIAAIFLCGLVIGIMIFASGTAGPLVFVAAVLIGLASGSEMSEIAYIVSRFFGYRAFGKIYGLMLSAFQLGGAIGAPALGIYYDRAGDYIGILWVLAAAGVVSTLLIALLDKQHQLDT